MTGPLILHYHALGEVPRRWDPFELVVSPAAFRRQLLRVRKLGYRFVAQRDLAAALAAGDPADQLCSVTFDDGTADNADVLPPLLEELEAPATIYACPGLLGQEYPFAEAGAGIRLMTRDELTETAAHPLIEIGSHTREHTLLGDASHDVALAEMRLSREALEQMLGVPVVSFAYPNCLYSEACLGAAEEAGYTSAVTCGRRGGTGLFDLPRQSPSPKDGPLRFELKARGAFDRTWDLPPVRAVRAVTRPLRARRAG